MPRRFKKTNGFSILSRIEILYITSMISKNDAIKVRQVCKRFRDCIPKNFTDMYFDPLIKYADAPDDIDPEEKIEKLFLKYQFFNRRYPNVKHVHVNVDWISSSIFHSSCFRMFPNSESINHIDYKSHFQIGAGYISREELARDNVRRNDGTTPVKYLSIIDFWNYQEFGRIPTQEERNADDIDMRNMVEVTSDEAKRLFETSDFKAKIMEVIEKNIMHITHIYFSGRYFSTDFIPAGIVSLSISDYSYETVDYIEAFGNLEHLRILNTSITPVSTKNFLDYVENSKLEVLEVGFIIDRSIPENIIERHLRSNTIRIFVFKGKRLGRDRLANRFPLILN